MMENNNITISDQDRELYGQNPVAVKNDSLALIDERSTTLSRPIDLPRIPTIGDMKLDGTISETDQAALNSLSCIYPTLSFDNLTPVEAIAINQYNEDIKGFDRKYIWSLIKPYFNSIFNIQLGDIASKMTEIARRMDNDPNYLPTIEWIALIAKRVLDARKDLFTYNIDLKTRQFNHREDPIAFLLILIKIQKEMYPTRNTKLSASFFSKFLLLIQSHAELIIKLKLEGKKGDDFFGSKYEKVKGDLRYLKSVSYGSFGGKPLSTNQQQALIQVIDDYYKVLELVFTVDPDSRALFDRTLERPKKDIKLCSLEVYHTFDDASNTRGSYHMKMKTYAESCNEIINSIYLKVKKGTSLNAVYKNGISMQHLTGFIEQYFAFDNLVDRNIIRQKELNGSNTIRTMIVNQFFDLLDKYM